MTRDDTGFRLEGRDRDRVVSEYLELRMDRRVGARLAGRHHAVILLAGCAVFGATVLVGMRRFPGRPFIPLTAGLLMLVLAVLSIIPRFGANRRLWWAAMRRCGYDVCCFCGYALDRRARGSSICPECGTRDEDQPVPLGPRREPATWPRFEVTPPEGADGADDTDGTADDGGTRRADTDGSDRPRPSRWF